MKILSLNGLWQAEGSLPGGRKLAFAGMVPGCVLNDLIGAGLAEKDPFWRDNAERVQEFEQGNWVYRKSFTLDEVNGQEWITFGRLDTYCDVYCNGRHLGSADNGHISHRFAAGKALRVGENRLEVRFYSPITRVEGKKPLGGAFTTERMHTRRTQCTYGWDWTMRFVTCGMGDEVWLERPADTPLTVEHSYVYTKTIDEDGAALGMELTFAPGGEGMLSLEIADPQGKIVWHALRWCEEEFLRLSADLAAPQLWYPNGYGEHPLYSLTVRCGEDVLDRVTFGIRTVRVLQLADEPGSEYHDKCLALKDTDFSREYDRNSEFSGFILKINGVKILCRGANWVPCEPFITDGMEEKITAHLELARDMGVNMLRIWGGGSFEREHFYHECSRLGILVTQDFLMACGQYPEDEQWFIDSLRKEAEYAALLLRNQPCLVWWSGDNENAVNGCDTDVNYMGRRSAYDGIAPVLDRLDPRRDFFPSSPFGGSKYASHTVGTTHNTQFLGNFFAWLGKEDLSDYKEYFKKYNARFIAEEPAMGAVSLDALRKIMTDKDIFGDDEAMWLYHTKTNPGLPRQLFAYMDDFARKIFGEYTGSEDRFFKRKYIHSEWMRVSLERVRREMWFCSGVIYWMLEDCWPAAAGWAILDYYCHPKDAFYTFRRLAGHTVLSLDEEDGRLNFHISRDQMGKESADLHWWIIGRDGQIRLQGEEASLALPENGAEIVHWLAADVLGPGEVLVGEMAGDRAFYRRGGLPLALCGEGDLTVSADGEGLTLTASRYIHAVELEAPVVFEDNLFSLLPGEVRRIGWRELDCPVSAGDIRVTGCVLMEK